MVRYLVIFLLFAISVYLIVDRDFSVATSMGDRLRNIVSGDDKRESATRNAPLPDMEDDQQEIYLGQIPKYALVIGNSNYNSGWAELPGVAEDLEELPDALVQAGFTVLTERDLDSMELAPTLKKFLDTYGADERNQLLVYFASHGATDSLTGNGYIVPTDAPLPDENPGEFRSKSLSMNIIKAMAKDIVARHVLFVFDSCFAGTIFGVDRSAPRSVRDGLNKKVRFFITAGGATERVLDRSIFRDQFVRGILGAADVGAQKDEVITDVELGRFLVTEVYDNAGAPHKPQWGWIDDPAFKEGVWFIPVPGSYLIPKTELLATGATMFARGDLENALDVWSRGATAGDVQLMKHLGDLYSGSPLIEIGDTRNLSAIFPERALADLVEGYSWYALAIAKFVPRERHNIYASDDRVLKQSLRSMATIRANLTDGMLRDALSRTRLRLEGGEPDKLYSIAMSYLYGEPFDRDLISSVTYLKLASDRGVAEAEMEFDRLKVILDESKLTEGVSRALAWTRPLPPEFAELTVQQKEIAQLRLDLEASRAAEAIGIERLVSVDVVQRILSSLGFYNGPVDYVMGPATREAIRRFQYSLASEAGEANEELRAVMTGVLTSDQLVLLVQRGAGAEDPLSQYILGIMYARGIGVPTDGERAVEWLQRAADKDFAIAHYGLGALFRDGITGAHPVTPDAEKAAYHFSRAATLGYRPAQAALKSLKLEIDRGTE